MVREPNERDAWVADAQRWITDITGVKQCRINLDSSGEIQEILVVAGMEKAPRRVVRDVETVLKARTDMVVDYKKISVAQTIDNQDGFDEDMPVENLPEEIRENEGDLPEAPPPLNVPEPHGPSAAMPSSALPASTVQATHHDTRHFFEDLPQDDPSDISPEMPLQGTRLSAQLDSTRANVLKFAGNSDHEDTVTGVGGTPLENQQPGEDGLAVQEEPIPAVILAEEVAPRLVCQNVAVMVNDLVVRAEVQLQAGQVEALGSVEGANHPDSDVLLVARATVEAIAQFLIDPVLLQVQEVRQEELGNQSVILTAINLIEGRRSETLFGACSTIHNRQQAVVHSVLDALNRRLSLMALKSGQATE